MTIDTLSDAELNEALKSELSQDEGTNLSEQEVEVEAEEQDEETQTEDETAEDEQSVQTEQPKKNKSNIAKILQERNELRKKVLELEEWVWNNKDTDLEYIKAVARQIASETNYQDKFYSQNEWAVEVKEEIEALMNEHNLDIDRAYKLYLLDNDPQELRIQQNKSNSKKQDISAYPKQKLRVDKPVAEMTTDELKQELFKGLKSGAIQF